MLDPWVIEEIRRREDERRRDERSRIEIHIPTPARDEGDAAKPSKDESERGVVIIDL